MFTLLHVFLAGASLAGKRKHDSLSRITWLLSLHVPAVRPLLFCHTSGSGPCYGEKGCSTLLLDMYVCRPLYFLTMTTSTWEVNAFEPGLMSSHGQIGRWLVYVASSNTILLYVRSQRRWDRWDLQTLRNPAWDLQALQFLHFFRSSSSCTL